MILPDIPASAIDNIEEQYNALVDLRAKLEELLTNSIIVDISNTATIISGTYVQTEVQQIADDTETVSNKVDEILVNLRNASIVGE